RTRGRPTCSIQAVCGRRPICHHHQWSSFLPSGPRRRTTVVTRRARHDRVQPATWVASLSMKAVVFDLDGVLVDSEQMWDEVRRWVVADYGGSWTDEATRAMQGMSTPEWATYLVDELGVDLSVEQAAQLTIGEMTR